MSEWPMSVSDSLDDAVTIYPDKQVIGVWIRTTGGADVFLNKEKCKSVVDAINAALSVGSWS